MPSPQFAGRHYDAIVIGLGAMGSAALFHLARRGRNVLGLEQFDIPHEKGSYHGITRIIRLAYYEHPTYVPLLRRAYELWRELEQLSGTKVLHITGSVDGGPENSDVFQGALKSSLLYDLPHQVLTSAELTKRMPGYRLSAETKVVFQPDGGFLLPEVCVSQHVTLAYAAGAEIRTRERVLGWEPKGDGVMVETANGRYSANRLIVSSGAWLGKLVPGMQTLAVPERQVLAWFQPERPEWFRPENFSVFNLTVEEGRYYGLPVYGVPGFKVGRYHHLREQVDPDTINREGSEGDARLLRDFAGRYFPKGAGPLMSLRVCMFTNTPDEHFVLDLLPGTPQVVIASPCSGHGFKFASVAGEILADLADEQTTRHDISIHRLSRFTV
jgi:sarcosine oxidase